MCCGTSYRGRRVHRPADPGGLSACPKPDMIVAVGGAGGWLEQQMGMKVLVTGAAGRLGRYCVADLIAGGFEVVAIDRRGNDSDNPAVNLVDLLDTAAVADIMKGIEAVVHLGNHPGALAYSKDRIFQENVTMNMNVFLAALNHGAKKIIFASSIQVIASETFEFTPASPPPYVAYLPLDSDSPPQPRNAYALSKWIGETMLRDYFVPAGLDAVALRFPTLVDPTRLERVWRHNLDILVQKRASDARISQGFGALMYEDAARLMTRLLSAPTPGYRVYLPAVCVPPIKEISEIIDTYYHGVPLRRPPAQMGSLIDISRIEKEIGWRPLNLMEQPPRDAAHA